MKLGDSFSGALRTFAYFMASGTHYKLEGVDYTSLYASEPSAIEQAFAIYANVIEMDKNGVVLNAKYAEERACQYIREYCDPTYKPQPPFEDWETELHDPPPLQDVGNQPKHANFNDFTWKISEIARKLNSLYFDGENLTSEFSEKIQQSNISDKRKRDFTLFYETLFEDFPHEFEGEVAGFRQRIINSKNYIDFIIKHEEISEDILQKIIDNELTPAEKLQIFKGNTAKEIVERIKQIQTDWQAVFRAAKFYRVRENFEQFEYFAKSKRGE